MRKSTRSILQELSDLGVSRDKNLVIESRGTNLIQSAVNLLTLIKENYDIETAKGRKNRAKYCREWDPQESLERIIKEFPNPEVECVQCDWHGTVDETWDNDGEMVCPKCKQPVEFIEENV